jgi:hypothetical protein
MPAPMRLVDGVSLGFPRTLAGAEAAAAHYLLEIERAMDGLSPRRTSIVALLLATPSEAQTVEARAADVIALDREDGPPLRRVAIATNPLAYSTQAAQVTVLEAWLYAHANEEAAWAIERVSLAWRRGDWRVTAIAGAAPSADESLAQLRAQFAFPGAGDASVR